MTYAICTTAADATGWYAVLKDLQTLFAAVFALAAALVAFAGVRHNARMNYNATQDSTKAKIDYDSKQAIIASNKKQAAIVTWMLGRAFDARRMMEDSAITVIKFEQAYIFAKNHEAHLRQSIQRFSPVINATPDVYERSDLSKVTLEFITQMDEVDMEYFFAVTRSIGSYDQCMRSIKKDFAGWDATIEKGEKLHNEDIEIMLRHGKKNIEYECQFIRGLEETIAKRYREIRKRFHPELAAAPPEDKADIPVEAATAS